MKRIALIVFIGVLAGIGFYLVTGLVKITQIDIIGNVHNTEEEILEIVGFSKESTVRDTIKHRPKLIENIGYISKIEVSYPSITSISINVIEKERMGYVKYMSAYLCVDSNGYIIDSVKKPDEKVARIEGINLKSFSLNEPLDIEEDTKLALLNIYKLMQSYGLTAEAINLNFKKTENIEVDLGNVKVRLGNSQRLEEKFGLLKDIMATMDKEKQGILYLENPDKKIVFKKTNVIQASDSEQNPDSPKDEKKQ